MNDVDSIAREVYLEFAASNQQHVVEHPVCEVCGNAPSVRINRWGTIKACCWECLADEEREFEAACAEDLRVQRELDALEGR